MASVAKVSGTGLNGSGIEKGAVTQMTAVISPIKVSCFVVTGRLFEDVCSI